MASLTTRKAARDRIRQVFEAALDRVIPAGESIPLKGTAFLDFEEQVEGLSRQVLPVLMEERAALEPDAMVETPGRCPYCASDRVYLKKQVTQPELRSPHGVVVVPKQHARCRACNGSFSPSGS